MAKFKNTSEQALAFRILRVSYSCEPGGVVELPDAAAPFVKPRGLPLQLVDGEQVAAEPPTPAKNAGPRKVGKPAAEPPFAGDVS